jgi:hypothetical protein
MRSAGDHPRRNRGSTAEAVVLVLRLVVIVANMAEFLDATVAAVNRDAPWPNQARSANLRGLADSRDVP